MDWLDEMKSEAKRARERQASSSGGHMWSIYGNEAIVKPGQEVVIRLMPPSMVGFTKKGKPDPEWPCPCIYFGALEHWFEGEDSKVKHTWCPKSFDEKAPCPLCDASAELNKSSDKAHSTAGYKMRAKEVYLYNAIVGVPGSRLLDADGNVDIRILAVPQTIFIAISDIITGGETAEFGRGNVAHPLEGYELKLKRPAFNSKNERWSVTPAPKASQVSAGDGDLWKDGKWAKRLVSPRDLVKREMLSYESLYKMFHGEEPSDSSEAGALVDTGNAPDEGSTDWMGGGNNADDEGESKKQAKRQAKKEDDTGASDEWPGFGLPE